MEVIHGKQAATGSDEDFRNKRRTSTMLGEAQRLRKEHLEKILKEGRRSCASPAIQKSSGLASNMTVVLLSS